MQKASMVSVDIIGSCWKLV